MIPTITRHPTKPNVFVDEHGEEFIMRITTGKSCYGFLGDDGLMHETVTDEAGTVIETRDTPFDIWNSGGAEAYHHARKTTD